MFWIRIVSAGVLLFFGAACILANAWFAWKSMVRGERAPSPIPLVGGLLAAAGLALCPVEGSWMWVGAPLLIDLGGAPGLLIACRRGAFDRTPPPEDGESR